MTKHYIVLLVFISFFALQDSKAQDIHFTSYDFAPLTVNPALSGAFLGTYRVGAIYRDQWRSVSGFGTDKGYKTGNIHVDMPIIRGIRKQDWIGIGVDVYYDQAGSFNLTTTKSLQGLSYHLALDKKQTQIISFGVQNGTATRKVNRGNDIVTETLLRNEFTGTPQGMSDTDLFSEQGGTLVDWVGGVMFSSYQRNLSFIRAGLSVGRITRANQSFANGRDRQNIKFSAFGLYDIPLQGNLFLTPQLFYQRTGNNQELLTQVKASYLFNEEKGVYINGGLGYRVGDALQLLVGFDYNDIKVQLSYDANINKFRGATNTVGAFELGVSYIGKVFKKPKIDPTKVCPRL